MSKAQANLYFSVHHPFKFCALFFVLIPNSIIKKIELIKPRKAVVKVSLLCLVMLTKFNLIVEMLKYLFICKITTKFQRRIL